MNQLEVDHPSAADLVAFGLGRLDEGQAVEVEAHLAMCETCRGAVDAAPTDPFVAKVQAACPPDAAGLAARRPAGTISGPRPSHLVAAYRRYPRRLATHPRYRLTELLGAGGMGTVFKAEHLLMKRGRRQGYPFGAVHRPSRHRTLRPRNGGGGQADTPEHRARL